MGRRPRQTLLQRRHTDSESTHEKMLNITNYQRSSNQKNSEILPHTSQNGHNHKNQQTINAGEFAEKMKHSCIVDGNINWTATREQ